MSQPQATRRCRPIIHHLSKWLLLPQKCNKLSTGTQQRLNNLLAKRLCKAFCRAILYKVSFPLLNKREKNLEYSEPLKWDNRAISLALLIIILYPPNHHQRTTHLRSPPRHPGVGIRKHTLIAKFYDQVYVVYGHKTHSQVIRNRGHGFLKRFITLLGCTTLHTCANRLLMPVY
jgi:hypothetical protein